MQIAHQELLCRQAERNDKPLGLGCEGLSGASQRLGDFNFGRNFRLTVGADPGEWLGWRGWNGLLAEVVEPLVNPFTPVFWRVAKGVGPRGDSNPSFVGGGGRLGAGYRVFKYSTRASFSLADRPVPNSWPWLPLPLLAVSNLVPTRWASGVAVMKPTFFWS